MAHTTTLSTSIRRLPKPYNHHQFTTPRQTRSLWSCSNQGYYTPHNLHKHHIRFILKNHQRYRRPHNPYREDRDSRTVYPDYHFQAWRSPSWGWNSRAHSSRWKYDYLDCQRKSRHMRRDDDGVFFDDRARQHLEWIKKEVERDPYEAVFGKRSNLAPFGLGSGFKLENGFTSLCRSFFGLDKEEPKPKPAKGSGSADTVDASATTVQGTDEPPRASGDKVQTAEDEYAPQTQPWPSSTRDGFEFDPISGRMVPKPSKSAKSSEGEYKNSKTTGTKVEGLESWPEVDFPSLEKQLSPELRIPPNRDIAESTNQEPSTTLESRNQAEDVFQSPFTSQGNTPSFQKASDSVPESLDGGLPREALEALQGAIPQTKKRPKPQTQEDYAKANTLFYGEADQPRQSLQFDNNAGPGTSVAEHREPKEGLERAGYLSKRDQEALAPASSNTSLPQEVASNEEEDLDVLRASDIRAAYETRRESILSEIKADTAKDLHEPISHWDVKDVDNDVNLPADESEVSLSSSNKLPDIPTAEHLAEPAPTETTIESEAAPAASEPLISETYRIFAYDRTTSIVTEGETISSLPASSEHVHPTDVLARLKYPAKFLPCLNQMHAEGYEIVSGGKDILVFKKVPESERSTGSQYEMHDGSSSATDPSGSEASTQLAQDDLYIRNSPGYSSTDKSTQGPSKGRVRNTLRRMFITGVATAGTCYAIGVVTEYFRTGGEDGWGVDGFTVFESERRHREQ